MDAPLISPRSPELMSRHDTALLVVDVQEKLWPLIPLRTGLMWNVTRLLEGASILGMTVAGTEQYPKGLGPLMPELAARIPERPAKTMFSCRECSGLIEQFRQRKLSKILVVGMESHVCIQQTVLDLLADGFRVYVAVDAIGARHAIDHEFAIRRMESCGAVLTTTEAALFEWCETAQAAEFKQISGLVRLTPPADESLSP